MKIVITGAGGFIGKALTGSLAAQGHSILALDNGFRGSLDSIMVSSNIECVKCDILNGSGLAELTKGADAIYHLAYINGTKFFYEIPEKVLEVGIVGTHNILKTCIKNHVPNFYLASSSEVYQSADTIPTSENVECKVPDVMNPRYSYGGGKIACELLTINYLRSNNIRFVIFRPHNIYGPQMGHEHVIPELIYKIYKKMQNGHCAGTDCEIDIQGTGRETRSFMYIDDAIRAVEICTINNAESGIYHIGNMDEIEIIEVVKLVARICNVKLKINNIDSPRGGTKRRCPDNQKICRLGYRQEVSLQEGLRRTFDWYWDNFQRRGM